VFGGAVARDSVLSVGGSVRCGHGPYAERLGSDDTLANGRRRRAPTAELGARQHIPPRGRPQRVTADMALLGATVGYPWCRVVSDASRSPAEATGP
jgi:hypothetical protein